MRLVFAGTPDPAVVALEALLGSSDSRLASIAAKAVKETRYHFRFSAGWMVRLGDGTAESHRRAARAIAEGRFREQIVPVEVKGARARAASTPTSTRAPT